MDAKSIRRMNARSLAEEVGGVTTLAGMAGVACECQIVAETLTKGLFHRIVDRNIGDG